MTHEPRPETQRIDISIISTRFYDIFLYQLSKTELSNLWLGIINSVSFCQESLVYRQLFEEELITGTGAELKESSLCHYFHHDLGQPSKDCSTCPLFLSS